MSALLDTGRPWYTDRTILGWTKVLDPDVVLALVGVATGACMTITFSWLDNSLEEWGADPVERTVKGAMVLTCDPWSNELLLLTPHHPVPVTVPMDRCTAASLDV